ncbi:phosphate acyltransferase PlsX [Motiliproteus sp. MSK22-1]|uniref:phosphate acyltransferase PlsX n=1 Tax=Motiliproteus sp. MSK22-1 TaxID=1897630 RepID=UPI0009762B73|nr:phosphate acyltransferase PlsX [Motiliproteus sp. MSK22-1]OMH32653.1 phosphate acyltransferase [Motiliproteus sp. MSK22-1]
MAAKCTLAIDAMSGDFGPHVIVPSALEFLTRYNDCHLLLVGDQNQLRSLINQHSASANTNLEVIHTDEVVGMDEKPSLALRKRKASSLYRSIALVSEGIADASVSAGNTGAMMAMGRYLLQTHAGIDRPAIASELPTREGHCYMLDLGANVDCSAEHLFQFALMGSVLSEAVDGRQHPKVGLLNVGTEKVKGNEQVKLASRLIQEHSQLNYIGYIEGNDIYAGKADVVICDGFVGNIALKSSEGLARLMGRSLNVAFNQSLYRRALRWLAAPVLKELQELIDPSKRNGASLLGLQGVVIKSHGSANHSCFIHAIEQARAEVVSGLSQRLNDRLATMI